MTSDSIRNILANLFVCLFKPYFTIVRTDVSQNICAKTTYLYYHATNGYGCKNVCKIFLNQASEESLTETTAEPNAEDLVLIFKLSPLSFNNT